MGGKDSKQKPTHGALFIEMNEVTQIAGQMMYGIVHLDLWKPYTAHVLKIELEGVEKTKWVKKERHGKHKHFKKHRGKNTIISISHPLHNFQGNMAQPGQYSFPFNFQLPAWLPSSFIFYGPKRSDMSVSYSIKVSMEEAIDSSRTTLQSITSSRRIIVRQPAMNVGSYKRF